MPPKEVPKGKCSVNYYMGTAVGTMRQNNPSAFRDKNVSSSYEGYFPTSTPFNIIR